MEMGDSFEYYWEMQRLFESDELRYALAAGATPPLLASGLDGDARIADLHAAIAAST